MGTLTLGSLFDGSGGFCLGGILAGIKPVWASEIEPFPIRVTTKRLPFVKHYGDVNKLDGHELEPVDIITFGSPCTDLSIAGKRAGLEGSQSGLFHQAIRVIKEMREKTNGNYPRFIVWENVPGAFSSHNGDDFKKVLEEICGICDGSVSVPGSAKWEPAGLILGEGFSVAWRILDADAWGVPQRRKRIYLVGHLTGHSAGKVLFESEGVSGYSAEGFRSWQRTACRIKSGAGEAGAICLNDQGGVVMNVTEDVTCTLRAEAHHPPVVMSAGFCTEHSAKAGNIGYKEEKSPTLRAGVVPATLYENHGNDSRYTGPLDAAPTMAANYGKGGNNQPFVVHQEVFGICSKDSNSMKSGNPKSGFYDANTSRTLDGNGGNPSCNQGGIAVVETVKTFDVRQSSDGTQNMRNHAYESDTCRTVDRGGNMPGSNQGGIAVLCPEHPTFCSSKNSHFTRAAEEKAGSLVATDYKDPPFINCHYAVRRLTPTECARLQGFPDWWCAGLETPEPTEEEIRFWMDVFETHRQVMGTAKKSRTRNQVIKWLKNPHTDSAEYKMWGNGVALPCVFFVLAGIAYFADK
ncbi:MAG: DNA cytosine methyltransferase [Acidaminococcaceae bacterium]|nr:DNA cytosine methyltransferase [Acidaminococcaceae bacterium]